MTDTLLQFYVPSFATLIVVAIAILVNNARISYLSATVNKRMDDLTVHFTARLEDLRADTFRRLDRMEQHNTELSSQYTQLSNQYERLSNHLAVR